MNPKAGEIWQHFNKYALQAGLYTKTVRKCWIVSLPTLLN